MSKLRAILAIIALLTAGIVRAEVRNNPENSNASPAAATSASAAPDSASPEAVPQNDKTSKSKCPTPKIQNLRPTNQRGIKMFETQKEAGVPFEGVKVDFGAAFEQTFQALEHRNTAISCSRANM